MDITLYSCTAEPNRLDKTSFLTSKKAITGAVPRGDIGCMTPTITIEAVDSEIVGANYCYISDWGRYYFITDIHCPVDGLFIISLRTDVLMSFKDNIKQLTGVVSRNRDNYDLYLRDDRVPIGARKTFSVMKFPSTPFPDESGSRIYILTLGGQ